jgi:hypothetical protein
MDSFHLINLFFKILAVLTSAARIVNLKKYNNHITTIQLSKINFYKIQISQTTQIKTTKITSTSSKQNKTQNNHLNHLNLNIKHLQKNSYMVLYSIKHQNFIIFFKKTYMFFKKESPRPNKRPRAIYNNVVLKESSQKLHQKFVPN